MNILFINNFCVGFMDSEILKVSVFGYFTLLIIIIQLYLWYKLWYISHNDYLVIILYYIIEYLILDEYEIIDDNCNEEMLPSVVLEY